MPSASKTRSRSSASGAPYCVAYFRRSAVVRAFFVEMRTFRIYKTAQWMADEVNDLIKPDFVQFAGDNVQHARDSEFVLFKEVGEHVLEVRLTDANKAEGVDRITFLCDRSGRCNLFPSVEPIVRGTKFCRTQQKVARITAAGRSRPRETARTSSRSPSPTDRISCSSRADT